MRLSNYLYDNDLNESLQSAYKEQHSCKTALLRVQDDILKSVDNKQCVVLLLLDLSAAFDTVDHAILLHRLRSNFGSVASVVSYRSFLISSNRWDCLFSSPALIWCTLGVPCWARCCISYTRSHRVT